MKLIHLPDELHVLRWTKQIVKLVVDTNSAIRCKNRWAVWRGSVYFGFNAERHLEEGGNYEGNCVLTIEFERNATVEEKLDVVH